MSINWSKIQKHDIIKNQLIKPIVTRNKCGNILINLLAGVQKPRIYNAKKVDNNILSNNKDIAASLSTYFTEIEPTRSNQIPQTNDNVDEFVEQDFGLFKFKKISIDDVRNVIKKLNASKSHGSDKIPASILKDSSDITAIYHTDIY